MITTITKVTTPRIRKDNHSGGWYHDGIKTEWFVTYDRETVEVPDVCEAGHFTPDSTRNWIAGNGNVTDLQLKEAGSDGTLLGDIAAWCKIDQANVKLGKVEGLPPIPRQIEPHPASKNAYRLKGDTLSARILAWKNKL